MIMETLELFMVIVEGLIIGVNLAAAGMLFGQIPSVEDNIRFLTSNVGLRNVLAFTMLVNCINDIVLFADGMIYQSEGREIYIIWVVYHILASGLFFYNFPITVFLLAMILGKSTKINPKLWSIYWLRVLVLSFVSATLILNTVIAVAIIDLSGRGL